MQTVERGNDIKRACLSFIHRERVLNGLVTSLKWLLYVEQTDQKLKNETDEELGKKRFWNATVELLDDNRPDWYTYIVILIEKVATTRKIGAYSWSLCSHN
jgi:hypothetical protein